MPAPGCHVGERCGMMDPTTRMAVLSRSTCVLLLAAALSGQHWSLAGTTPTFAFGAANDLLVHDGHGWLGFDEIAGDTILGTATGWTIVPSPIPPRLHAGLAMGNSFVYLFGGVDLATGHSNAMWRFLRASGWSQMTAGGAGAPGPSPRFRCRVAAASFGYVMVFFGGIDGSGNMPADSWAMLDVQGLPLWGQLANPPSGRIEHAMASGPGGSVVLFGGFAGVPLGDTWVMRGSSWSQHFGPGPAPAANARMAYDAARDLTVLVHPNGETWEWNDHAWRLVGATGAPVWSLPAVAFDPRPDGGSRAFQAGAAGLDRYDFTPSPASWNLTLDMTCSAMPGAALELATFERSLPVLGQPLHLRATGVPPGSFFVGVCDPPPQPQVPLGCQCMLGVSGVAGVLQFVPGTTTVRDWFVPIPPSPALYRVPFLTQGVVVHPSQPCLVMTTQLGQAVPGW